MKIPALMVCIGLLFFMLGMIPMAEVLVHFFGRSLFLLYMFDGGLVMFSAGGLVLFYFLSRWRKQVATNLGLICPSCSRPLTDKALNDALRTSHCPWCCQLVFE